VEHRLFYCDHYAIPLPVGHKFPMAKYRILRDLLAADGCFRFEAAPFAQPAVIELAHDAAYVRNFLNGALAEAAIRAGEAIWPAERIMPFAAKGRASACSTISRWPSNGCDPRGAFSGRR
jgi:hypothetical protein